LVDDFEDLVEYKGCKDGRKRAALGKAFMLVEVVPCVVGFAVPAFIGFTIDKVEKGEEATEFGMLCEG
jgi:hypothetical protein